MANSTSRYRRIGGHQDAAVHLISAREGAMEPRAERITGPGAGVLILHRALDVPYYRVHFCGGELEGWCFGASHAGDSRTLPGHGRHQTARNNNMEDFLLARENYCTPHMQERRTDERCLNLASGALNLPLHALAAHAMVAPICSDDRSPQRTGCDGGR